MLFKSARRLLMRESRLWNISPETSSEPETNDYSPLGHRTPPPAPASPAALTWRRPAPSPPSRLPAFPRPTAMPTRPFKPVFRHVNKAADRKPPQRAARSFPTPRSSGRAGAGDRHGGVHPRPLPGRPPPTSRWRRGPPGQGTPAAPQALPLAAAAGRSRP